jgi:hypothetical protein
MGRAARAGRRWRLRLCSECSWSNGRETTEAHLSVAEAGLFYASRRLFILRSCSRHLLDRCGVLYGQSASTPCGEPVVVGSSFCRPGQQPVGSEARAPGCASRCAYEADEWRCSRAAKPMSSASVVLRSRSRFPGSRLARTTTPVLVSFTKPTNPRYPPVAP